MYICMSWYACMYVCTYICLYVCMYVSMHMHVCTPVCMYVWMYGYMYVGMQCHAEPPCQSASESLLPLKKPSAPYIDGTHTYYCDHPTRKGVCQNERKTTPIIYRSHTPIPYSLVYTDFKCKLQVHDHFPPAFCDHLTKERVC